MPPTSVIFTFFLEFSLKIFFNNIFRYFFMNAKKLKKKRRLIYGRFSILIRQVNFLKMAKKIAFSNIRCANVVNFQADCCSSSSDWMIGEKGWK